MLVDGVGVIGVVQSHAQQPAELGDKRAQHAAAVHFQQRLVDAVLPLENIEKRLVGLGRAAQLVVDFVRVLAQQFAALVAQFAIVFLQIVEHTDQVFRVRFENLGFGHVDMAARNTHAFA